MSGVSIYRFDHCYISFDPNQHRNPIPNQNYPIVSGGRRYDSKNLTLNNSCYLEIYFYYTIIRRLSRSLLQNISYIECLKQVGEVGQAL